LEPSRVSAAGTCCPKITTFSSVFSNLQKSSEIHVFVSTVSSLFSGLPLLVCRVLIKSLVQIFSTPFAVLFAFFYALLFFFLPTKSFPHVNIPALELLQLGFYPLSHGLEQSNVSIDSTAHATEQSIFHFTHLFSIIFNSRVHHILCFVLAFHHGAVQTVLKLGDFLLNKMIGLLAGHLTIMGAILQNVAGTSSASLIVALQNTLKTFAGNHSDTGALQFVQDARSGGFDFGIERLGFGLKSRTGHGRSLEKLLAIGCTKFADCPQRVMK
jgi:hypothetical protein